VVLPAAVLVYLGTSMLLRTIPREDMQALYSATLGRRFRTSSPSRTNQQETEPELYLVDETVRTSEDSTVPEV